MNKEPRSPQFNEIMKMAPNVGHVIISFASIDTIIAKLVELVRPKCEADGTSLKYAKNTSDRISTFKRAFKSKSLSEWSDQSSELIHRIKKLKDIRDLLCHGSLQIHNIENGELYFSKVNPNNERTMQLEEVLNINQTSLNMASIDAVKLNRDIYIFYAELLESL